MSAARVSLPSLSQKLYGSQSSVKVQEQMSQ